MGMPQLPGELGRSQGVRRDIFWADCKPFMVLDAL